MVWGPVQYSHWLLHVVPLIHSTDIFATDVCMLNASFVPSPTSVICSSASLPA